MLSHLYVLLQGGGGILALLVVGFQIWMLVDALRRKEYIWAVIIFLFSGLSALFYYLLVYRSAGGPGNPLAGFEMPGAADRRRIKELEASIHHLDKAHHHLQLGDIYFRQGKFEQAEACYLEAYKRDARDEDIRARLGNCMARRGDTTEALPLLEAVAAENPKHDYGSTLMTLAETQAAAGQKDRALATWQKVLTFYSYARARVQYAQMLIERQDYEPARKLLHEVISDEPHEAKFQRKREKVWVDRAKALMPSIPGEGSI